MKLKPNYKIAYLQLSPASRRILKQQKRDNKIFYSEFVNQAILCYNDYIIKTLVDKENLKNG